MALDIACGAPTQIDELTSFIMRESERPKVPAASCKTVDRLIKGLALAARARVIKPRGSIDYPVLGRTCPGFPRFSATTGFAVPARLSERPSTTMNGLLRWRLPHFGG